MPFVNAGQRKACFAQAARDREAGLKPRWDCHKFANETTVGGRKRKIHKGPRGGKYIIVNGQKRYIKTY